VNNKLMAVAWWEYSEKIRSKAFIVSLILLPAVIVALVIVPAAFISGSGNETYEIGLLDETGQYAAPFRDLLETRSAPDDGKPDFRLVDLPYHDSADIVQAAVFADSMVARGELAGYFILRSPFGGIVNAEYRSGSVGGARLIERLTPILREAVTAVRLRERGIDPGLVAELGRSLRVRTLALSREGGFRETAFEQVFFSVYMYMMMLFFIIMTSGQLLVRSMLEEKSNRIVELLLSSVSPQDIMGGKIIGLGALGVTQLATWGIVATVAAHFSGLPIIPIGDALLMSVYFVLGYLLYAAVFVTAGAPLSTEQEAQQVTTIVSLGLVVPLALSVPVMQDPGSTLAVVLTLIPVFTPMMMAIRIPSQLPPLHEIVVSLFILGASVVLLMRLAGRIFSASVLLSGKRLSIAELRAVLREPG
jgi:ABC-2 type transport system permease protein